MQLTSDVYRIVDRLNAGVMVFSATGAALYANCAARAALGVVWEVAVPLDGFVTEDGKPLPAEEHPVAAAIREKKNVEIAALGVCPVPGKRTEWLRVHASPVLSVENQVECVVVTLTNVTKEREMLHSLQNREKMLGTIDVIDSQTGLSNRRHSRHILQGAIENAKMTDSPLAVALVDLDRFKVVNQACGRTCGDETLVHMVELLGNCMRTNDIAARTGGGEILVVMPGFTAKQGYEMMEAFRSSLSASIVPCLGRPVTVSGGVAEMHKGDSVKDLLRRADGLLYLAKLDGRDRIIQEDVVSEVS